jgi:excisionase family DNA binding protein
LLYHRKPLNGKKDIIRMTGRWLDMNETLGARHEKTLMPGEKYNLTIKEAAAYFSIGEKKLRRIAEENHEVGFVLMNGSHMLLKRNAFEKYIDMTSSI